jgi:Fuc2NAc and GlcNAc transferase
MPAVAVGVAMLSIVLATWLATGLVRRFALQNALLDIPNARSSHLVPTARGGGLAIVGIFVACLALLALSRALDAGIAAALAVAGGAVAAVGYWDDRQTLSARLRFGVHLAAAGLVVWTVGGVDDAALRAFGLHGGFAGIVIALLALAWMTNLFNFMDGIDGIAASEAVFIAGAGAGLCWAGGADPGLVEALLALAGASLGFLLWNWPPARIFMGDVGSGFLGFMLAALALAASRRGGIAFASWVILSGVFCVDATVTLLRRIARGDRWFEAHRTHAYQRLARRWSAHLPVTGLVIAIDALWLLPWAWTAAHHRAEAGWCVCAALLPLVCLALLAGAGAVERQGPS